METQKNFVCPKRGRESGCKGVKGSYMRERGGSDSWSRQKSLS